MKRICAIFLFSCMTPVSRMCATRQSPVSHLNQVFYHDSGQASSSIELGKIVFYFSKDVTLTQPEIMQAVHNGIKTVEFRFDAAQATPDIIDTARKLFTKIDKKICTIELTARNGEKPSVVLRIAYNPDKVGFESELFDAIKHEKGFMCTLLNRSLLKRLSQDSTCVLRTVSHDKKHGIFIDMGHGGQDCGALSVRAMAEKDVTLAIGMKLSALLHAQGFEVFCTRSDDRFVPLDARTTLCNQCDKADILVSIHANSGGPDVCGIETFCYNPGSKKTVCDIPRAQQELYNTAIVAKRYEQSLSLAQLIQSSLIEQAKKNSVRWLTVA